MVIIMKKKTYRYGFIGVGSIASAIARGFIENGVAAAGEMMMFDICRERVDAFASLGAARAVDGVEVAESCRCVIVAVQPYQMRDCLSGLVGADIASDTVIVSIAASVPTEFVTRTMKKRLGVIRLMPNMPMLIGEGAVAATRNDLVSDEVFDAFIGDLEKIAIVSVMEETLLNAVISVNASSPAYVYLLVRAMLEGAESQGIPREVAEPLILRTIEGAVGVIKHEKKPIETLIKNVCTPGGTTIAAMNSFDKSDFSKLVGDAMRACTARADEMTAELEADG